MRCYTHPYEIFGSPERIKTMSHCKDMKLRNMLMWLTRNNIVITFRFDHRNKRYSIDVSPDSWHRLKTLLPELGKMVVDVAPNRCEFAAV
jgi:hypothetical protein